jgi:flavin-dependent dehydrogenase
MREERTQVVIVGARPAGLMLGRQTASHCGVPAANAAFAVAQRALAGPAE